MELRPKRWRAFIDLVAAHAAFVYAAALIAIVAAAFMMASASVALNATGRGVYAVFVYGDLPAARSYFAGTLLFTSLTALSSAIWWFCWHTLQREAIPGAPMLARRARRIYNYVVAALGLALFAVTMPDLLRILSVSVLTRVVYPEATVVQGILIVVGLAAWAFHWWALQRRLSSDERRSLPRRVYLYLVVLAGSVPLLLFVVALLMLLFPAAASRDSVSLWMPTAVVGGVLAAWHWRIIDGDRAALAG